MSIQGAEPLLGEKAFATPRAPPARVTYSLAPDAELGERGAAAPYLEKETAQSVRKVLRRLGVGREDPSMPPGVKDGTLESLDYTLFASAVNLASLRPTGAWEWRLRSLKRWLLCLAIGVATALLATGIIFFTKRLSAVKFDTLSSYTSTVQGAPTPSNIATAFAIFAAISVAFATAGALVVAYIEPLAAGSGIPELKAFINGVNLPRLLRFKTLVAKVLALPLSMGSGLPVGYEGPMAHIGASMASMLSQGKSNFLGCGVPALPSVTFRLDQHKREFVCVGAAAGVAAAFNAPAGAVVFVIEEMGAAMWQKGLLWRSFFAAVVAAYVIDFLLSGANAGSWGRLTASGMFSFGLPDASEINDDSSWCVYEIPIFVVLGGLGGLAGALFNRLSKALLRFRIRAIAPSRLRRVLDVAAVTLLVSCVTFFVPLYAGECLSTRSATANAALSGVGSSGTFFCPQGSYNDLGALWFSTPEEGIRLLFHEKAGTLSPRSLALFWALYLALMCLCSGAGIPSGHFIPSLLAGSALGRLVGELARSSAFSGYPLASPGAYAVIGAASMLGGILRLSLSMTIILLEATGNAFFSLPLMVTLMTARFVGDALSPGLYETQLAVRAWPVLEERLPKPQCYSLRACDVMSSPPLVLPEVETAGAIQRLLLSCSHGGFPVVYRREGSSGTLAGYIQRRHLAVLLEQRVFHSAVPPTLHSSAAAAAAAEAAEAEEGSLFGPGSSSSSSRGMRGSLNALPLPRDPSDPRLRLRVPSAAGGDSHVLLEDHLLLNSMSPLAQGVGWGSDTDSARSSSLVASPVGSAGGGFSAAASTGSRNASARAPPPGPLLAALNPLAAHPPPHFSQRAVSRARLAARLYTSLTQARQEALYHNEPLAPASAFSAAYPRYPDVRALTLSREEQAMFVDLRLYMDSTPVTVHCHAPLERAHRLFLSLGLRHLMVIDDASNIVGVITRKELTQESVAARGSLFL